MCGECNWPLKEEKKDVRKPRGTSIQPPESIQKNNSLSTHEEIKHQWHHGD
jgi:hypothetical protein